MSSQFFSYCRFHLFRLLRAQPGVVGVLIFSTLALVLVSLATLQQWQQLHQQEQQLLELRAQSRQHPAAAALAKPAFTTPTIYPAFHSAQLADTFNQLATEAKLSLDEVSYGLDDNANQPYLRYRVTLAVTATYPLIRQFVDQIALTLPHVSLDTISCTREDIGAIHLSCELAFSAIFRKETNG